jgi:hypothetical protein
MRPFDREIAKYKHSKTSKTKKNVREMGEV